MPDRSTLDEELLADGPLYITQASFDLQILPTLILMYHDYAALTWLLLLTLNNTNRQSLDVVLADTQCDSAQWTEIVYMSLLGEH